MKASFLAAGYQWRTGRRISINHFIPAYIHMEPVIRFVIKNRIAVLAALVAITVFMGYQASMIQVDPAVESMVLEDDPTNVSYQKFKEVFGRDEFGVILYYDESLFTASNLKGIGRITKALDKMTVELPVEEGAEGKPLNLRPITEVVSLTNVDQIRGEEWGMDVDKFIRSFPEDPSEMAAVKREAISEEMYSGVIVNDTGDTTAILFELDNRADTNITREVIISKIHEIIDAERSGMPGQFELLGNPVAKTRMVNLTGSDSKTFFPLSLVLICVFLYLIFRSVRGVMLPLLSVVLAFVWTLGMIVLTGQKFTVTTTTMIPLIQVYGVATVVHIFSHLSDDLSKSTSDKVSTLIHTCGYIAIPCFLTSLTTAIGFSSNAVSEIVPVRVAGLITAFGVLCTYVVAFTLVPIALYYLPAKTQQKRYQEGFVNRFMVWMLSGIIHINRTHPKKVLAIWLAIGIGGIAGLANLKVETQVINFFKQSDPLRQGYDFVEEHLGGINSIEVIVECDGQDCVYEPEALIAFDKASAYIVEAHPEVTKAYGYPHLLKKMHQAMNEGNPEFYKIPSSRQLIAQYMLLFTGDATGQISENGDKARVTIRVETLPSPRLRAIITDLNQYLEKELPEGFTGRGTGGAVLYANMVDTLVNGQLKSLGLAFFFILICMSFILRSFKVGLISMIPNMIPIFFNFGLMGITGITLNISTAMIAAIAIGIAVDNTTHYLWRVNREFQKDGDYDAAMERTIMAVGRPMSYTAVIIVSGFLVICLGSFIPNIHFGLLSGVTMLSAALADLFLTPVIILLFKPLKFQGDKS